MAVYGAYSGAIKATFPEIVTAAIPDGVDTPIDISFPAPPQSGATYVVCVVTTSADVRIEIGNPSTPTSFLLTATDELICTLASDRPLSLQGDSSTPVVTIKRFVTG